MTLKVYVFSNIGTTKDVEGHEQDGKRSQTLPKSARQDLYHIY